MKDLAPAGTAVVILQARVSDLLKRLLHQCFDEVCPLGVAAEIHLDRRLVLAGRCLHVHLRMQFQHRLEVLQGFVDLVVLEFEAGDGHRHRFSLFLEDVLEPFALLDQIVSLATDLSKEDSRRLLDPVTILVGILHEDAELFGQLLVLLGAMLRNFEVEHLVSFDY